MREAGSGGVAANAEVREGVKECFRDITYTHDKIMDSKEAFMNIFLFI
jgi:hypothetical protein